MQLTRRGRIVVAAALSVLLIGLVLVVWPTARRIVPGAPDCTVEVGKRTVELSTEQVENASALVAEGVRTKRSAAVLTTGLTRALEDVNRAEAAAIVSALMGQTPAALSCLHGGASQDEADALDGRGLTARAAVVRTEVAERFSKPPLGGFAKGGVRTGHMPGSAHYEGRAIDIFYRPVNAANKSRGWALAQYFVANAERLQLTTVIFDDQIWTARRAVQGWREYNVDTAGKNARIAAVLEHRDHVHVDVAD